MDAFYASVEMRDNPSLIGKPVIIGSLPTERGVVATCSYEARKFGVRSAMNIKEAYRLCPDGVYMHPNFEKYKAVSNQLHAIWDNYATVSEYIALDEAYLDVTETAKNFDKAGEFGREIKRRVLEELGLSCSVGIGYSMASAKTASEEMKPDGYYEIRSQQDFVDLVVDREVRVLYSVGTKTAEKLNAMGIVSVRDLLERQEEVADRFGSQGEFIINIASGIDDRRVVPYKPEEAKSISREMTFQEDVYDLRLLSDVLLLLSISVVQRAERYGLHGSGVVLKVTYSDMKSITRSRTTVACNDPMSVSREAIDMLYALKRRPIRLIGVGIFNLSNRKVRQLTLDDIFDLETGERDIALHRALDEMKKRYHYEFDPNSEVFSNEHLHSVVEHMRTHRYPS